MPFLLVTVPPRSFIPTLTAVARVGAWRGDAAKIIAIQTTAIADGMILVAFITSVSLNHVVAGFSPRFFRPERGLKARDYSLSGNVKSRAIVAQLEADSEMNWCQPFGKLSKVCGCTGTARVGA